MRTLMLIDGSSLLSTCYYGTLPNEIRFEKDPERQKMLYPKILHDANGRYTNGMYAMLKILRKIMEKQAPSHIAFAFDKTRETFRRDLYPEYKAQRKPTPEPLREQFVQMESLLAKIGCHVYISKKYEADDLLGSLAEKYKCEIPVHILTKDRDYLQLVDQNVRLWLLEKDQETADALNETYSGVYGDMKGLIPDKCFEVTPDKCLEEFGVRPEQIPDLKGLQGDTSDNIPGVKGVMAPAVPLLKEYGSIENLYDSIESCAGKTEEKELNAFWKELGIARSPLNALRKGKESAFLSKRLATIVRSIDLPGSLEDYTFRVNEKRKKDLYLSYGFRSLL